MKRFAAGLIAALFCLPALALADARGDAAVASNAASLVYFKNVPKPFQLYPRDLKTSRATIPISGVVPAPGFDTILVRVSGGKAKPQALTKKLAYKSGKAEFLVNAVIPAELADHEVVVCLLKGGQETVVARVAGVVAGDVYLINGQSNAEAHSFNGSANTNASPFLRSFGSRVHNAKVDSDVAWHPAEGDAVEGPGAVGQWGMRLGRMLVDSEKVPVAIINAALGGQPIEHYARDAADPANLNSNYGRMLFRCRKAGVDRHARAILWYQGESDNGNGQAHETGFLALRKAWKEDYPELARIYVMQLRTGCGTDQWSVDQRDRQRRWPQQYPDISVMSANGIDEHDGCHYAYTGYAKIADRLFNLVERDLYGRKNKGPIDAPDIASARFSKADHTQITLATRNKADVLRADAGAEKDFWLDGSPAKISRITAKGNTLELELTASAPEATAVFYSGHSGPGPWIVNQSAIGILTGRFPLPATTKPAR